MRLAQLDRAFGYGPKGRGFESSNARLKLTAGTFDGRLPLFLFCVGMRMEQTAKNLRVCKKCLLRDMEGQEEYVRSLQEYIENLDIDIRADQALYERRLSVCRDCEMLFQGMCRSCGCYVELRAAVAKNACPWKKW